MRTMVVAVACLTVSSAIAQAQWLEKTEDDPFGTKKSSISMTASAAGYAFGFRCTARDDVALVFLTTEAATDGSAAMNLLAPILKIRVDDAPVVDLPAKIDTAAGKLRLYSDASEVLTIAQSIAAARRRVAVAVEVAGSRFHTQSFGVYGSKNAIQKSLNACGIRPDASN